MKGAMGIGIRKAQIAYHNLMVLVAVLVLTCTVVCFALPVRIPASMQLSCKWYINLHASSGFVVALQQHPTFSLSLWGGIPHGVRLFRHMTGDIDLVHMHECYPY